MGSEPNYGFFAMLDRMQYIARWGLMRNSKTENIKEHSFDVAVIAQCLALMYNRNNTGEESLRVDPYKAACLGLYHDCTEILTGDLPTPIKYRNKEITKAYKEVESEAARFIAELGMRYTPEHPLYVTAIGAITNVASALLLAPELVDRIVVVWLGGRWCKPDLIPNLRGTGAQMVPSPKS